MAKIAQQEQQQVKNKVLKKQTKKLRLRLSDFYIDRLYLKPLYFNLFFSFYFNKFLHTKIKQLKLKKNIYVPSNYVYYIREKRDVLHISKRFKVFFLKKTLKYNAPYYLSFENFLLRVFGLDMFQKLYNFFKNFKFKKFNFLKKKFLIFYSYYRNSNIKSLKFRIKKFKTRFFFFYIKSKRNKILQKYYNLRFFFSNFSLKHYYRKMLYFYQFYSKVFFFKNKKYLLNFNFLKKYYNSKKNYYFLYLLLNQRLVSWVFNLGFKNAKNLIRKKKIYINGRVASFKNIILKKNDFIIFNLKLNLNNLHYIYLLKHILINKYTEKNTFKTKKKFLLKSDYSFFINNYHLYSVGYNMDRYNVRYPKIFYSKIYKRLTYLKHKNYPLFKELKIKRNKYFKFKYLIKSKRLSKKKIQNIFKKYRILFKYKETQDSMNVFFRKVRIFELEKRTKDLRNYNESIYRKLKN